jgi:hypothetical protein
MIRLTDEQYRQAAALKERAREHRAELRIIQAERLRLSMLSLGIDPDRDRSRDRLTRKEARAKIDKLRAVTVKNGAAPAEEQKATEAIRQLETEYFPRERLEKAWRAFEKVSVSDSGVIEDERLFQKRLRKLIEEANELLKERTSNVR